MDDPKKAAKAAKKAAKAQAKLDKKAAKEAPLVGTVDVVQPGAAPSAPAPVKPSPPGAKLGPTPAERSAAAAERQVQLQRYRVWLGILAVLVALATFLATVRPWRYLQSPETPTESIAPVETTTP